MNLKEQRAAALKAAQDVIDGAKAATRDLTADEQTAVKGKFDEVDAFDVQLKAAADSDALMGRLGSLGAPSTEDTDRETSKGAKSLGEHFVKHVGTSGLARLKHTTNTAVDAPEWSPSGAKAAGDTHHTPESIAPWLTQLDTGVLRAFRRPTVSDLLGTGTLGNGSNAVTYLVEGPIEGAFETVAPKGQKPKFHIGDPTPRTDALRKLAGYIEFSDEMIEDASFWVSEVNSRGLYLLAMAEEAQLLRGDGVGQNILGLLKREGVQAATSESVEGNPDAIYRAITAVQTATGLSADGIVLNPVDYERLRLNKDGNGQYFGGGYFAGQYGSGGIEWQPPVWGLRTVVSAAVPVGEAVVGAFSAASTVYRKGGVRVESTNSHAGNFTTNVVTTRIEERIALAVRQPSAVVKLSLAQPSTEPAA